ncbi:probable tyrosyl-DNA phosphodiesterase [Diachasma alloeum]|uniref:probable tyrosyl-DNA phosphodiesterase n=1 Tax=Diachasma alloeum TaxID=454923 RepID=UPI0007383891|nr:probable tyrosyl-DNA phosphodiesterase [Diachasma alloeum]
MDSPVKNSSQPTKQICPFGDKCYRKNPVHFSEMSHPHLEDLVENQLEDPVQLPDSLAFECRDRSLLLDQLKIVQMILRKEREIPISNGRMSCSQLTNSQSPARALPSPQIRNSPAARLPLVSNPQGSPVSSTRHLTPSTLTSKLTNSPAAPSLKREIDSPDSTEAKKPRELPRSQTPPRPSQSPPPPSQGPRPSKALSIFERYHTCSTLKSREEFRKTAMMQMIRENQPIPFMGSKGEFDMKYALSSPYFVFLTAVQDSPETWSQPYSITFPEILDTSLGEIEESLHINFMVDIGWLCLQYLLACQSPQMLVLLGQRCDTVPLPESIKVVKVEPPSKYGTHHSKISVLKYKTGVRIIVSTANLYEDDWQNRTQALWISPHLPELREGADKTEGESKTGFKRDFLSYLQNYGPNRVQHWLDVLERTDFSSIDVFFLASVPGNHKEGNRDRWGLRRLGTLLSSHAELPADGARWPVVAQCSSIGSLGAGFQSWIGNDLVTTLSSETRKGLRSAPNFQFVYPTIENYKRSFDMRVGSCCLPYGGQLHAKQKWLSNYCHQWKSSDKARCQAMPHVKSYTRISPDFKKIPWMVITSANMSKAAWGWGGKANNTILSYEAGVVFFPKFLTNSTTFPIQEPDETGTPPFPLPYDVPLTPYGPQDEIFTFDFFKD